MILIPFVIFFVCVIALLVLAREVRKALAARHPEVWLQISAKVYFPDNAIYGFAWRRQDKPLNDPEITRRVNQFLIVSATAVAAWVVMIGLVLTSAGMTRH